MVPCHHPTAQSWVGWGQSCPLGPSLPPAPGHGGGGGLPSMGPQRCPLGAAGQVPAGGWHAVSPSLLYQGGPWVTWGLGRPPPPTNPSAVTLFIYYSSRFTFCGVHTGFTVPGPQGGCLPPTSPRRVWQRFSLGVRGSPRALWCSGWGSQQPCGISGFGGDVCPNPQGVALCLGGPGGMAAVGSPPCPPQSWVLHPGRCLVGTAGDTAAQSVGPIWREGEG